MSDIHMTKAQEQAHKLIRKVNHKNKDKISEEFLYNAICYFEMKPEDVVKLLSRMSKEKCDELAMAFDDARKYVNGILKKTLDDGDFSEAFHNKELEDILFYQVAHGHDIG